MNASTRTAIEDHYRTNVSVSALIAKIDAATESISTIEDRMNPSQRAAARARAARHSTLIPR